MCKSLSSSGWKAVTSWLPCLAATIWPSTEAKDAHVVLHAFYIGRTDERGRETGAHLRHVEGGVEATQLSSIGVAARADIHRGEAWVLLAIHLLGQQDQSGTGAEDGQSAGNGFADGLEQLGSWSNFSIVVDSPPGMTQAVLGLVPVGELAHLKTFSAQLLEHSLVLDECSLQG